MARIVLPNGTECYMKRDRISLTYFESGVDSLIDHLNHFLGVEYLWGGTTPYGFDCSGLLYRVGRMHGYDLSRDSADQALQDVEVEEPQRGDMLFSEVEKG
jgi:Cell wall-associated hydrolases (invasion-associated proteins)